MTSALNPEHSGHRDHDGLTPYEMVGACVQDPDRWMTSTQAKVYVSVLGPEEKWVSSFKALESARGFIWSWLRKNLDLRVTPQLLFRPDRSMEHAARMSALLSGLRPADDRPDED